jgi:hypothetical protein
MILTNAVTSTATIANTSVSASTPVDSVAPRGFMAGSIGRAWSGLPGIIKSINAQGVVAATANLDWSLYSYFSFTTTSGTNLTLTFGKTGSTTTSSWTIGQIVKVRVTGAGTPTITWPSTVTWVGTLAAGGGSSSAPLVSDGNQLDITLTCTGVNTFAGRYTAL